MLRCHVMTGLTLRTARYGLILASARREQAARPAATGVRALNPLRDSDDELEEDEEEENTIDWVQAALKVGLRSLQDSSFVAKRDENYKLGT